MEGDRRVRLIKRKYFVGSSLSTTTHMIHVFPRWSFGYLLQAKPKHTAAGHEVIYVTYTIFKIP